MIQSMRSLAGLLALLGLIPGELLAQQSDVPDWFLRLRLPNAAAKSMLTPSAWGAAYGMVFAGAGLTDRSPYLKSTDGVLALGVGLGDPVLALGVQLTTTMSDVSDSDNFSVSFKVHRYLGDGTAIAVGGESLFTNDALADDLGESFYAVVSHTFQGVASARPGVGRLHATLGVGSGRFANTSPRDISEGKREDGTRVFGNVAVEVHPDVNLVAEWSGINLHAGASVAVPIAGKIVGLTLGLADLTGYSGDGVRLVGGGAVGVSF
ncbi:MAG: hypothetical protein BMS9Abin29_2250 [Gemmatimonadota bacterium]|nr:MAG: hypothetical protein BMS9Abin29_2250 [Gemmatimonadota bacterium]